MEDTRAVEALLDSHAKGAHEPLIDEDGTTIDTGYVMERMREIGEKITAVSLPLNIEPLAQGSVFYCLFNRN